MKQTKRRDQENSQQDSLGLQADGDEGTELENFWASQAWAEYKRETKHSPTYFREQRERVMDIVEEIKKRNTIMQSKASALQARSSRALMLQSGAENDNPAKLFLPYQALLREPTISSSRSRTVSGTMQKTVEEVILAEEPYTSHVKSSQLSPFMRDYVPKLHTGHDVVVPVSLPDDRLLKDHERMWRSASALAHRPPREELLTNVVASKRTYTRHKVMPSIDEPQIVRSNEPVSRMPCVCGKCLVDYCRSRQVAERHALRLSDGSSHDAIKRRQPGDLPRARNARNARRHNSNEPRGIRPESRLAEKTLFNELYGAIIHKRLAETVESQRLHQDSLLALKGELQIPQSPGSTSTKQKQVISGAKILRTPSRDSLPPKTVPSFLLRSGEKPRTSSGRSLKLTAAIKKLQPRYVDKQAVAAGQKLIWEKEQRAKFTLALRRTNTKLKQLAIRANHEATNYFPLL